MLRRPALVGLAIALVVPLAACSETTRLPEAEPSSEVAPLFASDEEALAAATAAYEEYLAASNLVTGSEDLNLDPIRDLVTQQFLENEQAALEQFELSGTRSQGRSRLVNSSLQQWFEDGDDRTVVLIYVCVDVSEVSLTDSTGNDLTPADRAPLVPLEVELVEDATGSGRFLVSTSSLWEGSAVCG